MDQECGQDLPSISVKAQSGSKISKIDYKNLFISRMGLLNSGGCLSKSVWEKIRKERLYGGLNSMDKGRKCYLKAEFLLSLKKHTGVHLREPNKLS